MASCAMVSCCDITARAAATMVCTGTLSLHRILELSSDTAGQPCIGEGPSDASVISRLTVSQVRSFTVTTYTSLAMLTAYICWRHIKLKGTPEDTWPGL